MARKVRHASLIQHLGIARRFVFTERALLDLKKDVRQFGSDNATRHLTRASQAVRGSAQAMDEVLFHDYRALPLCWNKVYVGATPQDLRDTAESLLDYYHEAGDVERYLELMALVKKWGGDGK